MKAFKHSYSATFEDWAAFWTKQGQPDREYTLSQLRSQLNLWEKYPKTYDLRKYVLDRAKTELDEFGDYSFTYDVCKVGKSIAGFYLHFYPIARTASAHQDVPVPATDSKQGNSSAAPAKQPLAEEQQHEEDSQLTITNEPLKKKVWICRFLAQIWRFFNKG